MRSLDRLDEPLVIDCDECSMQNTSTCEDCIVTFLCADEAVVIDVAEARALRLLAESGLTPPLRHRHRRHAG